MTLWQRAYRALGGGGPDDPGDDPCGPIAPAYHLFKWCKTLGFIKRDATLPIEEQGWCINFKWQWRFWRGPYYDCFEAWDPPLQPYETGLKGIWARWRRDR